VSFWNAAFVLSFSLFHAKAELSAFERALSTGSSLNTQESIVEIGGQRFRKIEFKNETYYLKLLQSEGTQSELVVLCNESEAARAGRGSPALVTAAVRVTKRTRLFIEGLRTVCDGGARRAKTVIAPDLQVGFMFDDSQDPKTVFRDRRITIDPVKQQLGFGASW